MKIYIIGSGGVGGYFGGKLAKAGNDVTFLARGDHFDAIKANGLTVKNTDEDFIIKPAKVIKDVSEISNPDLILFTVKTYDTESISKELVKYVNENTVIITFQNGIDNDLKIKDLIKNAQVYPGIAYVVSAKTEPGVISQTGGLKKLVFGDRESSSNGKLKEIETLIRNAGIDANVTEDIVSDLWKKFIFINAFSGMTSFYKQSIGDVLKDEDKLKMYEDCVRESINVAKKLNVKLPETIFEDTMKLSKDTNPLAKSSLLLDIENNRRNEIDSLNGTLVRLGEENNVEVRVNEKIYKAIKD